jgi:ribonucleoside-triphosphate reductase
MSSIDYLSEFIYKSKYAKYLKDKKRRENWDETVTRIKDMMLRKYGHIEPVLDDINFAYDMLLNKKVLGSQRAMQFGGEPIERKNARIYNCAYSPANRPRFFAEYFWLLLVGSGCGMSVQEHDINCLPTILHPKDTIETFIVPDTIEGWADCASVLLSSYFGIAVEERFSRFCGRTVQFDYSLIRRKNSPLSYGGKAPGASGLKKSIEKIRKLLDRCLKDGQTTLRSIDVYDICMHLSDAVLSGGVRRSSTVCLFSKNDLLMRNAKIGNWRKDNPQRARSNNSVFLLRSDTTFEEFNDIIQSTKEFGEPGFVFTDDLGGGLNPCLEIFLFPFLVTNENKYKEFLLSYDKKGIRDYKAAGLEVGWQTCNLSTINGKLIKTKDDFFEGIKAATIIGTLQAGFTDMGYLGEVTQKICEKESLLGVSITGIMDSPAILLDKDILKEGAEYSKLINKAIAEKININVAARITCLKPEGTGSIVLETLANGIHCNHSRRFIRACQVNQSETPYQFLKTKLDDIAIERSIWCADKTDDIIYFPIIIAEESKIKKDYNATKFLDVVKLFQQHWIANGKNTDNCVNKDAMHNVSNTVIVKDDEWDEVSKLIYNNRNYYCGVSLIGDYGDKDYCQAPFQAVYTLEEIENIYGEVYKVVADYYTTIEPIRSAELWDVCDNPTDQMIILSGNFDSYRTFCYCLKDIHNHYFFEKLLDTYKNAKVDYNEMIELDDSTEYTKEISCVGGACMI